MRLKPEQLRIANEPLSGTACLSGAAGTGKTTAAVARLERLFEQGIRGDQILVLAPQQALLEPYKQLLRSARGRAPNQPQPLLAVSPAVPVTLLAPGGALAVSLR
jgi:primosomal protein N'